MESLLLGGLAALSLVFVLWDHFRRARAIAHPAPPPPPPRRHPSVSVIRPVRGLDVGAQANFRAALAQDYPGDLEVLMVFDDREDPAWVPTQRQVAQLPEDAPPVRLLVAGAPPPGRTGKLNAMMVGLAAARCERVAFLDSDTRPSPGLLRRLVEALEAAPDAADAFSPALVAEPPRTAGDVAYAMLMNAWYGCSAARWAKRTGGLPFIMGQFMVWRREALERIGGLAAADHQLVDDMALGRAATAHGLRNLLIDQPLHLFTGGMTVVQFLHLFRRWLLFSRNGLPSRFTVESWLRGLAIWMAFAVALAAIANGLLWPGLVAALSLGAESASQLALHRQFGGASVPLRWAWVPTAVALVAPFVVAVTLVHKKVDWRGRDYSIDRQAHLEGDSAAGRAVSV